MKYFLKFFQSMVVLICLLIFPVTSQALDYKPEYMVPTVTVSNQDGSFVVRRTASGMSLFKLLPGKQGEQFSHTISYYSDHHLWKAERYYSTIKTVAAPHNIYVLGLGDHGISLFRFDTSDKSLPPHRMLVKNPPWVRPTDTESEYKSLRVAIENQTIYVSRRSARGVDVYATDLSNYVETFSIHDPNNPTTNVSWIKLGGTISEYSDQAGGNVPSVYETLQLVPDPASLSLFVIGRTKNGIMTHSLFLSKDSLSFGRKAILPYPQRPWNKTAAISIDWSDTNGWDKPEYYSTIQALHGFGKGRNKGLYIFGRGPNGIEAYFMNTSNQRYIYAEAIDSRSNKHLFKDRAPNAVDVPLFNSERTAYMPEAGLANTPWQEEPYYSTLKLITSGDKVFLFARNKYWLEVYEYKTDANKSYDSNWFTRVVTQQYLYSDLHFAEKAHYRSISLSATQNELTVFSNFLFPNQFYLGKMAINSANIEAEIYSLPKTIHVNPPTVPQTYKDLKGLIDNQELALDSDVIDTELVGWSEKFGNREEWDDHVQGIAYTADRRFVLAVELDSTCSVLAWSTPFNPEKDDEDDIKWDYQCNLDGDHPYTIQAMGNIIGVGTKSAANSRFFRISDDGLEELNFTYTDPPEGEVPIPVYGSLAMAYNAHQRTFYIIGATNSQGTESNEKLSIYAHEIPADQPDGAISCNGDDECNFTKLDWDPEVLVSQGGMALVDIKGKPSMALINFYTSHGAEWVDVNQLNFNEQSVSEHFDERQGATQVGQLLWNRPSARFGATAAVTKDGSLYFVWAGALIIIDSGLADYEIAIQKVN